MAFCCLNNQYRIYLNLLASSLHRLRSLRDNAEAAEVKIGELVRAEWAEDSCCLGFFLEEVLNGGRGGCDPRLESGSCAQNLGRDDYGMMRGTVIGGDNHGIRCICA